MTAKEYAFIKGNDVVNIAVFDEPTEELLDVFKQEHDLDNIVLSDGEALVGFTWDGSSFIPPKPYESWVLNSDTKTWEAPIEMPEDGNFYEWDEATGTWKEILISKSTKPFDSWIWDEATSVWKAPIECPSDGATYRWNEELASWETVVDTP